MIRILIIAALLGFIAQQPPDSPDSPYDTDGHMKAEHQIPAGDYCQKTQVYEENAARLATRGKTPTGAHPCSCSYACQVDANGNVIETGGEKTTACKSFCSKEGRRCTCHVEEPCLDGAHNALMDMDGNLVAVARK